MSKLPPFSVNADMFRIVAGFVTKDKPGFCPPYYYGVWLEPHSKRGAVLTASDGYTLLSMYDEDGSVTEPVIVPVTKPILAATKRPRDELLSRSLVVDNGGNMNVWSGDSDPRLVCNFPSVAPIVASFPDVRFLLKVSKENGEAVSNFHFPAVRIQRFTTAALEMNRIDFIGGVPNNTQLVLYRPSRSSSMVFVGFATSDAFGALMLSEDRPFDMPVWFKEK